LSSSVSCSELCLALDGQGVLVDVDLDVIGLDTRHGRLDADLVRGFNNVHSRRKDVLNSVTGARHPDKAVLEQPVHGLPERNQLV
jgi:hypothetical protein